MNEKRDEIREELFNSAYGFKPQIHVFYELNADKTFRLFRLRFVYNQREISLTEYYDGNTNMTDYCQLSNQENFDKFVDAERRVKEILNGES